MNTPVHHRAAVVHLNVIGFAQAVASALDRSLVDRVFVVAAPGPRTTLLDVSPRAREEGLEPGMSLQAAERRVRDLQVIAPAPSSWELACADMERIACRYAPVVENAGHGHLYLDLAGTERLLGPPADCAARVRNEICCDLGFDPTVAVAANKLTAKVLTRTLGPAGFAVLREGDEAAFLASQDLRVLPGVGPKILRIMDAVGIHNIGELASLTENEARLLLGRDSATLIRAARGIDTDPVYPLPLKERNIRRDLDFAATTTDLTVLRGALMALTEDTGMELRKSRLVCGRLELSLRYADGLESVAGENLSVPAVLDEALFSASWTCLRRAQNRRVRLRSLSIALSRLEPDLRERDLFTPEGGTVRDRLQESLDLVRRRYGQLALSRGTALLARNYGA